MDHLLSTQPHVSHLPLVGRHRHQLGRVPSLVYTEPRELATENFAVPRSDNEGLMFAATNESARVAEGERVLGGAQHLALEPLVVTQ